MRSLFVTVALLAAGTALAQAGFAPPLAPVDDTFASDVAAANQTQIELGQLAAEKGATAEIRVLGRAMIDAHVQSSERLREIARRQGVVLSSQRTAEQKSALGRLSMVSGTDFDNAYRDELRRDQQWRMSLYHHEALHGVDPRLRSFARSALPSLREREQLANRPTHQM